MFWGIWDQLRIFIELTHQPFLVTFVVFLGDEELNFLLLFEAMISQASKSGAHSFSGNSAAVFTCLFVFLSRMTRINRSCARKQALALGPLEYKTCPLRKREHENKTGGNWGEEGSGACNHFFKRLVPVYQLLIYPLIGQIWQVQYQHSQSGSFVPLRKRACGVHARKIGNLRTMTTTLSTTIGSELQSTAHERPVNFVVVVLSTTPNKLESRRPAIQKLRQV